MYVYMYMKFVQINTIDTKLKLNKFGFPESLKCHLFGINYFYKT
jgi:hypothetical protein